MITLGRALHVGNKQSYRMFNKKRSLIPDIWGLKARWCKLNPGRKHLVSAPATKI